MNKYVNQSNDNYKLLNNKRKDNRKNKQDLLNNNDNYNNAILINNNNLNLKDGLDNYNNNNNELNDLKYDKNILSTINRYLLDFDFEKRCSITNSKFNIYSCLVCGIYLQGKGTSTPAYIHSLQENHCVFICLTTGVIYILPDNIKIKDSSLDDIVLNLFPKYNKDYIENKLDKNLNICYSLEGKKFIPGTLGLNNIKKTDYVSVVIQSLFKIKSLRDFFLLNDINKDFIVKSLLESNNSDSDIISKNDINIKAINILESNVGILVKRLSELFRKVYNTHNFKNHVNPHEFLQAVSVASNNKFKITNQSDVIQFLAWIINVLNNFFLSIKNNIISYSFKGKIMIKTYTEITDKNKDEIVKYDSKIIDYNGTKCVFSEKEQNFFYLTLELPDSPLYKKQDNNINIQQVSIYDLLEKYNCNKPVRDTKDPNVFYIYSITKYPKYLIVYYKRFNKNMFYTEKNNSIVSFPIKNLDIPCKNIKNNDNNKELIYSKNKYSYDLISNIIHDGKPDNGSFRVQIRNHFANEEWSDIRDLNVSSIVPQDVNVSESYIHFYEGYKITIQ